MSANEDQANVSEDSYQEAVNCNEHHNDKIDKNNDDQQWALARARRCSLSTGEG